MPSLADDLFGRRNGQRINSKRKGTANEREVARALTKWTGRKFIRSPHSGAVHVAHSAFAGDVVCAEEGYFWPYVVECKHLQSFEIRPVLRTNSIFHSLMAQVIQDAGRVQRVPMLWAKTDGQQGWWVCLDRPVAGLEPDFQAPGAAIYGYASQRLMVMNFEDFKKSVSLSP